MHPTASAPRELAQPALNDRVLCVQQATCPNCGASGAILHQGLRDLLFDAPGTWATRRCESRACGFHWLDPQPLDDQIPKLYETYYTHGTETEHASLAEAAPAPAETGHLRSKGVTRVVKRALSILMPWRRFSFEPDFLYLGDRRPGPVLEVGCGAGEFLRQLKATGWDVVGIDFDPAAAAMARRRGVDVRVGDLHSCRFETASFAAIAMNNVIEHLPHPEAIFAECRRILRPGGRLVLMTPNAESFCHAIFGPDWRGLEPPRHLYLYSARTLASHAERAGFARVEAFSQLRNRGGTDFMVSESRRIAVAAGRVPPHADGAALNRRASLLQWLGISRAEWVMMVAEK